MSRRLSQLVASASAHAIDFAALGAAFWIDASNPASYTATGTTLTSIKSLVSGTALSTVVGAPQIITDLRDGKPSYNFPNAPSDYVKGTDAPYIAAASGTDRAFLSLIVFAPGEVTNTATIDSVRSSVNTRGQDFTAVASDWYYQRQGAAGSKAATSEHTQAGCSVLAQYSLDGLTVFTSVNGGPWTSNTMVSAGVSVPDTVAIGVRTGTTDIFPFFGMLKERVYFGPTGWTVGDIPRWVAALQRKWPTTRAPNVCFVGDSITTTFGGVTNGGMVALLTQAVQAAGGLMDPEGPYSVNQIYPYKMSAVGGDTCAMQTTRVNSPTLGLGNGGASKGHYRKTRLVCLMAGANDIVIASPPSVYSTLLNAVYAQMITARPAGDFKIAVTSITNIPVSAAAVIAWNAALVLIWDAFEALHPGVLLRWDAYGTNPALSDGVHPTNAGYVSMTDNPTIGLAQAVVPYLMSIQ